MRVESLEQDCVLPGAVTKLYSPLFIIKKYSKSHNT